MNDEDTRTSSTCDKCPAHCCSNRFGYQSVNLTFDEKRDPLFAPYAEFGSLKLEGRHCRFLDPQANRCTIYEKRPFACRGFVCHDTVNQGDNTIAMVYRHRKLRELLAAEGKLPEIPHDMFWAEDSRRVPTVVRTYDQSHRYNQFDAGTWRFFKLEAVTGKLTLLCRRRSTRTEHTYLRKYQAGPVTVPTDPAALETKPAIQYDDIKSTATVEPEGSERDHQQVQSERVA